MNSVAEPVRRMVFFVLAVLVLCPASRVARANNEAPVATSALSSQSEQFDKAFYHALNRLSHGDGQSAFDELSALRRTALELGYADLPGYSLKLLYSAQGFEAGDGGDSQAQAAFLVRRATELSPTRSEIKLAAANFQQALGRAEALRFLFSGVFAGLNEPRMVAGFVLNTLLIGLVSVTLALFVVCAVQLATHSDTALAQLELALPVRSRGILGPIVLFLVLCVPLAGGLAAALAVWALFVAWALRGARWIAALSGLVLLSWALALPLLEHLSRALRSPTSAAIDRANTRAYMDGDSRILLDALKDAPGDPVIQFSAAKLLMAGDLPEARRLFAESAVGFEKNSSAQAAVKINLAAVAHLEHDFTLAKQMLSELEGAGVKRFEVYYNLALAELALTEMEGHRSNYAKALEADPERMRELEQSDRAGALPISVGLPFRQVLTAFFERSGDTTVLSRAERTAFESFFPTASPNQSAVFASLVIGVGLWLGRRRRPAVTWISSRAGEPSKVWLFLPAGSYLAGDRPFTGVLLLGVMLSGAVFAMGRPVSPVELFTFPVPLGQLGWIVALVCFAASMFMPLIKTKTAD